MAWRSGVAPGNSAAMARTAEAVLRSLGGGEVVLRFRGGAPADGASANPRLGLATELPDDVPLSPTVVRDAGKGRFECVISGSTIGTQVELRQTETAQALFDSALGIVHQDKLLRIVGVSVDEFGGAPYLYRVTIEE